MACSSCALHADVDGLCLRGLELSLCEDHVGLGGDPGRIAVLGELQRPVVGDHRRLQQLLLSVERRKQEIVLREFGPRAQLHSLEIGSAGLGARLIGFHAAPYLAPDVWFPGHVDR